ncbi:MAG: hypothetical protein HYX69_07860 [Planctomycetia bacterium]|nr:hypothetical protein [Planctomycetia bacterium]
MTNYQLAKLVVMAGAGGLRSRKRIQKTVHLLKASGCALNVDDFRMHYYGPYSAQLAARLDRMSATKMLSESPEVTTVGTQYTYSLSDHFRESFYAYEATPEGKRAKEDLERREPLLRMLYDARPRVLELASTIVEFFLGSGRDWNIASTKAAEFKGEPPESPNMRDAQALAQSVVGCADG